jgi:cyanophycin synthetase
MALITQNPSVDLLADHFRSKGYEFEKLILGNRGFTRFISPTGKSWLTQDAFISYPFLHETSHKIAGRKDLAYELCAKCDVSAPWTVSVNLHTPTEVLQECLSKGKVIVKPRSASLSRGVTLNIRNLEELQYAIRVALAFADVALVQQQITGEEVRFVVLNGRVKAAILRKTPYVTGDGQSTLRELVAAENDQRKTLTMKYLSYPELTDEIIDFSRVNLDEVPNAGQTVELGRGTMIKTGASIFNVIDEIHPDYVAIAEKLAHALGAGFVVVDIMIQDLRQPQTRDNYAFIEFNTAPVLKLFYSCRDGKHYDVLPELGAMIHASLQEAER